MSITSVTFTCPHCSAEHTTVGEPVYCDCGHGWQATLSAVHPPTEWYEAQALIEAKEKADAEEAEA